MHCCERLFLLGDIFLGVTYSLFADVQSLIRVTANLKSAWMHSKYVVPKKTFFTTHKALEVHAYLLLKGATFTLRIEIEAEPDSLAELHIQLDREYRCEALLGGAVYAQSVPSSTYLPSSGSALYSPLSILISLVEAGEQN